MPRAGQHVQHTLVSLLQQAWISSRLTHVPLVPCPKTDSATLGQATVEPWKGPGHYFHNRQVGHHQHVHFRAKRPSTAPRRQAETASPPPCLSRWPLDQGSHASHGVRHNPLASSAWLLLRPLTCASCRWSHVVILPGKGVRQAIVCQHDPCRTRPIRSVG